MRENPTRKGLAATYRQEIIQNVTLFASQSAAAFYDKLFTHLDFALPKAATGRRGFPKEAMVCAFIVMKCEGFSQITNLADYPDNNRLIAHYYSFNIMKPLPSYRIYDRFLKKLGNGELKKIMAQQVKRLYDLGIVDASFIVLDSTPVVANTNQNNPKTFATDKFKPENQPKAAPDCALGVHSAFNQHNERRYEFYWGYKDHVLVDCISRPPLYELTTPVNVADSTVVEEILAAANSTLPIQECTFLGDKGYDVKAVYDLVKDIYDGEAVIPLNKRNTKNPDQLPASSFVPLAWLCIRMGRLLTVEESAKNSAALCIHLNLGTAHVTTKTGTMANAAGAVPSISLCHPTTDCLLTGNVFNSSGLMPCVPNVNATTPALRRLARNDFGSVMPTVPPIRIRSLIFSL